MNKKWLRRKWVTIGVISVLVLGGGYWGYEHFKAKPAVSTNITSKAKKGNVSKVITATGTVSFSSSIQLTFKQSGEITAINVKPGDSVKAGQVLARVDDSSLQLALQQQQAAVITAQSQLQTLKDSYNVQTLASVQSAVAKAQEEVATAQENLSTAQQNADPNYLDNQVALAKKAVQQASNDYAKAQLNGNASSSALDTAIANLRTAQNTQNGGAAQTLVSAQAQYRAAQADLISAQAQLVQQEQGPTATELASDQANINSAQLQLASAQESLANAEIIAPVDGVVVSIPLELGQQTDSTSIITFTPAGENLEVDTSIAQSDINQVKLGQKVDITLDSNPDQHISGTVSSIPLQGTIASNVTTYAVEVKVDKATDILRAGMNANVSIITAEANNVLTVPSEAIKTIGNKKEVMVPVTSNKANSGSENTANVQYVPVEVGLDDGTNVEIKNGLKEGQEVVILLNSSSSKSTLANKSNNSLFGTLGGGSGGGPDGSSGGPPPSN